MGFRVAAALTAAVIAIGLVAAFVATHHASVGVAPAGDERNVKAYRDMMAGDYNAMNASTSDNCNTIDDKLCAAAIGRVVPRLQSWVDDLTAFRTPAQYAVLDAQLRLHLKEVIVELNSAVTFQKANDQRGFALAMSAAFYERGWVDPATFTITGTYAKVAGSHQDAVNVARQALQNCMNSTPAPADFGCSHLAAGESCEGAAAAQCEDDVQAAATQLETFLVGLTQNPAPSSLRVKDAKLQADLARADTALLGITDAILHNDATRLQTTRNAYVMAINDANGDALLANG